MRYATIARAIVEWGTSVQASGAEQISASFLFFSEREKS